MTQTHSGKVASSPDNQPSIPDEPEARDERDERDARDERHRGHRGPARSPGKTRLGEPPAVPAGRVTGLHERRAGSARYVISVDGNAVAVVSAELIARLGVRVGTVLDAASAELLAGGAGELAVFDKAVALLAARARSARELQLRLRRAGAAAEVIEPVIARLRALGFIDDAAYARSVARSRAEGGRASRRRIGQELQRRGVDRRVADAALQSVLEEVGLDEESGARAAAEKRMRALRGVDAETARRRLYAYLARRGYDGEVVARVVRDLVR